jgi:signal transduction histidine kinase
VTERAERSPLILVADDVPANVAALEEQLTVLGYRVVSAVDGPGALAACEAQRPDLCILDVSMPPGALGCDARDTGFEVCRRIKRDPRTARIPVIFVTALNDTSDRVKAIEAGGDDFLSKPHNRQVLSARVRSLLRLKFATEALEESYGRLRELEQVRDDLMKMIVHDLKTPLASVLASLEMVLDNDFGPISEPQRRALGDAESRAEELLTLIEDLLEVARIEETSLALERRPVAPGALLTEIAHEWGARFQRARTTATVAAADDAPVFQADRALLKRVFGNLIQNAIMHGGDDVALSLIAERDTGGGVLFTVADDGPGIPGEFHEAIFRKFERVRKADAPRVRSSGLGLTFCKLVVEAHGGRIWVESVEGKGSRFFIALPAGAAPSAAA